MGFTIFTKSGVFNPGNYGLSPGDSIQIVCVGAGAGGTGFSYNNYRLTYSSGGAGGASSFGNIVSAAGGLPGAKTSLQDSIILTKKEGNNSVNYGSGEPGQGGWLPGVGSLYSFSPSIIVTEGNVVSCSPSYGKGSTSWGGRCALNSKGADGNYFGIGSKGAYGTGSYDNGSNIYYNALGCGGSGGYGAGGPGACGCSQQLSIMGVTAGKAGTLAIKDYLITSLDDIAITVGLGGAYGSGSYVGGAGADGCVAIFW